MINALDNHVQQPPQWTTIRERGSLTGIRGAVILFRLLGRRFFLLISPLLALYYFAVHHRARRASYEYLTRLHAFALIKGVSTPKPTPLNVFKHFLTFSRTVIDKVSVWTGDMAVGDVRAHTEPLRRHLDQKKGAVLLSAHFGNVEVMRAVAKQTGIAAVSAFMFTKNAARFNRILKELNPESHVRIVSAESISVDTALDLESRIADGECVALLADRLSPTAPGRAVSVSFLGGEAKIPEGPFILSSVLGARVFFCASVHHRGGYEITITQFAERVSLPRAQRAAAIQSYAQLFASTLEGYCLEHPFEWSNFYDFWEPDTKDDGPRKPVPA